MVDFRDHLPLMSALNLHLVLRLPRHTAAAATPVAQLDLDARQAAPACLGRTYRHHYLDYLPHRSSVTDE